MAGPTRGKPTHVPCGQAVALLGICPTEIICTTMLTAASFEIVPTLEAPCMPTNNRRRQFAVAEAYTGILRENEKE